MPEFFTVSDWAEGDWNTDGGFDSCDLLAAFEAGHFQTSNGLRLVFEPAVDAADAALLGDSVSLQAAKRRSHD